MDHFLNIFVLPKHLHTYDSYYKKNKVKLRHVLVLPFPVTSYRIHEELTSRQVYLTNNPQYCMPLASQWSLFSPLLITTLLSLVVENSYLSQYPNTINTPPFAACNHFLFSKLSGPLVGLSMPIFAAFPLSAKEARNSTYIQLQEQPVHHDIEHSAATDHFCFHTSITKCQEYSFGCFFFFFEAGGLIQTSRNHVTMNQPAQLNLCNYFS